MKARALLFGLNYAGTNAALNGCINDVLNMAKYMGNMGIPCKVCRDDNDLMGDCKAMGILRNLYELALQSHSESLDFVYIHYSGHGSYVVDRNDDETDGKDECLVPTDYTTVGLISDDLLNSMMKYINPITRVVFVNDCCHSGTIVDVKYSWETETKCSIENILCSVPAKVITLSGCLDSQTSADAFNVDGTNTFTGALTSCMLHVLKNVPLAKSDVFTLLSALRGELKKRGFSQVPKLCSTHNLARDKKFLPF
jgi:hypothetical protein